MPPPSALGFRIRIQNKFNSMQYFNAAVDLAMGMILRPGKM
jgi:hypothetical protein